MDYYNAGIDHLATCVDDEVLKRLAWPPNEVRDAHLKDNRPSPSRSPGRQRFFPVGEWNSEKRLLAIKEVCGLHVFLNIPFKSSVCISESSCD